jgi:hypothetical protein
MLLEDLAAMGRGYEVRSGSATETGLGGGRADDAVERLRDLAATGRVTVLPYGAPDATALVRARLPGELRRTANYGVAVATEVLGTPVGRDLAWPVDGAADLATAAALRAAGASAIVLTGSSLPPAGEVTYTPTGRATLPDGTDVLLADDALSALAAATPARADQLCWRSSSGWPRPPW